MSDVSFEEPKYTPSTYSTSGVSTSRKNLFIRLGIARTEQESQYILLGIACLCIVVAGYIFLRQTHTPPPQVPPLPMQVTGSA
ncbi:hypothetical protein BH11PAT2_BH11PAT2_08030 [soil metagenome]